MLGPSVIDMALPATNKTDSAESKTIVESFFIFSPPFLTI
jgi:hypothetical protein